MTPSNPKVGRPWRIRKGSSTDAALAGIRHTNGLELVQRRLVRLIGRMIRDIDCSDRGDGCSADLHNDSCPKKKWRMELAQARVL